MGARITVLGLGNPLLGDDGIGPRVVRELREAGLPSGVDAVEGGAVFYRFFGVFARSAHILAVDAFRGGGAPGTVYLVPPGAVARGGKGGLRHEDDFPAVVDIMAWYGLRPQVSIIGVEPGGIGWSLELSAPVAARLPLVVRLARALANRLRRGGTLPRPGSRYPKGYALERAGSFPGAVPMRVADWFFEK